MRLLLVLNFNLLLLLGDLLRQVEFVLLLESLPNLGLQLLLQLLNLSTVRRPFARRLQLELVTQLLDFVL